jgi:hypothetical protein
MSDDVLKYSIADDYDPDDEMPTDTDPLEAYQVYIEDKDAGHGGDMGFYAGRLRAVHCRGAAAQEASGHNADKLTNRS